MKKLIFLIVLFALLLTSCGNKKGSDMVLQSDNNFITTYLSVNKVFVDSKRNTICWVYDDTSYVWETHYITKCLDFVAK
jgi:hypothetical protein